eukprot:7927723-Heterocapsa_arctica.AAC.1
MSQTPTSLSQRVKALEAAGKLGDQRPAGATRPGSRAPRAGDWTCPCGKYNFEWRMECLECEAQKKTPNGGSARTRSSSNRAKKDQGTPLALTNGTAPPKQDQAGIPDNIKLELTSARALLGSIKKAKVPPEAKAEEIAKAQARLQLAEAGARACKPLGDQMRASQDQVKSFQSAFNKAQEETKEADTYHAA